ncbi:MAG: glycerate kinase [Elusimicrobia bacterium]|nr:glycerate kinase [Elusimicrobiota bacterium]
MLVAPNAFKGSLTAGDAARALARGARKSIRPFPQIRLCPLADGGDDTLEVLSRVFGARPRRARVTGPLGRPLQALWAYAPRRRLAVIEMARASGLALVPPSSRNPEKTTAFGTGELLRAALDAGARTVYLALGGSATVDGGLGILQALGATIFVRAGNGLAPLSRPFLGGDFSRLASLDVEGLDPRLKKIRLFLLTDVRNPLLGAGGAARVFGPQKGATPAQVHRLEKGLALLERWTGKGAGPGSGAAGGVAAGLVPWAGARVLPGAPFVFDVVDLERNVRWADVVLTGEGRLDETSFGGKTVGGLVTLCRREKKILAIFAGSVTPGARRRGDRLGAAVVPLAPGLSTRRAMARAGVLLESAAANYFMGRVRRG